ncbi:DUF4184 family protein [Streptacidiphilus sp. PB12-B1b]|uniref:DUF4184 family protein n=1 Tax=Streptacidiphilus sp. PB12-B1b TaxID=2705012 RepID=UPI0015F9C5D0|nr:DUF4184 family protein [Streptacidiphilus sp. PB12-B1b]QMU77567.1 DUF4184 family protein [Streptacidiphilus sp. PB12-B1b]
MPFTFSHPAAVLPFLPPLRDGARRGPLIASALVAGSLAPDVPYFVESLLPGSYAIGRATHRPWAVPTLDVALAAGLVGAWHGLLREPLVALLPGPWADRAEALTAPVGKRDPYDAAWFTASAALGALTHVGWDAFTHVGRAGERLVPALRRRVAGVPVPLALQWTTSAAGLGVLAAAGTRLLRTAAPAPLRTTLDPAARRSASAFIAVSAALGAAHRLGREAPADGARPSLSALAATVSFGGGAGAAAGATGYALAVRLLPARRRPEPRPGVSPRRPERPGRPLPPPAPDAAPGG